jgi:hypothetical protein
MEYKTTLLVPYRNRKEHMDYFLTHSWPLLQAGMERVRLVVIEQQPGKLFNRGKLLNVGFKEFKNTDFFITQDVDVNPLESALPLYNLEPGNKEVTGIYSSPCQSLGGIVKIRREAVQKLNGFPNTYWGWGVEDRAFYNRALYFRYTPKFHIFSKSEEAKEYFNVFDNVHDRIRDNLFHRRTDYEYNTFQNLMNSQKERHILSDGLNTIEYRIIERKHIQENVEWITVQI